jgi:hypothetical protein
MPKLGGYWVWKMTDTIIRFEVPTFGYNQMYKLSTKNFVLQGAIYNMLIGQHS